jgi:parvulin-like peptidyl-prolyl isomerase
MVTATFARGGHDPAVEQAVAELAVGDVSPPVSTREGLALFRLRARHPERLQSLDAATPAIQARLAARRQEEQWKGLQGELWAAEGVVVDEDRLRAAMPSRRATDPERPAVGATEQGGPR